MPLASEPGRECRRVWQNTGASDKLRVVPIYGNKPNRVTVQKSSKVWFPNMSNIAFDKLDVENPHLAIICGKSHVMTSFSTSIIYIQ